MNDDRIREQIHLAVDETAKAAVRDPWLAQKIRAQAERKDEEPVRKKLPAGMMIILAVILLLTAVAAAMTNGFGLLEYYENQVNNTAFVNMIMPLGKTWEGKYFSAEIREAVFDGTKMSFSMSVAPREGTSQVFVIPRVKAAAGEKELETCCSGGGGLYEENSFWVPDLDTLIGHDSAFNPDNIVFEYSLIDDQVNPVTLDENVQWTVTFDILHTDWNIRFMNMPDESDATEETDEQFRKMYEEAYQRHELILNEDGNNMESVIPHVCPYDGSEADIDYYENQYLDYLEELFTRDVFTLEEKAVFRFTADRAEVRRAHEPAGITLPDGLEVRVVQAEATANQVNVILEAVHADRQEPVEPEEWNWVFEARSDDAEMIVYGGQSGQELNDQDEFVFRDLTRYETTKPVHTFKLTPVRTERTSDGETGRKYEELSIIVEME